MKILQLSEVLNIAQNANEYAREIIISGSTRLENNTLDQNHFDMHKLAISDVRMNANYRRIFSLLEHPIVTFFESSIESSTKYSVGNCFELALQALDYILINKIQINAEVFNIKNGDHVFLVLNRPPNSMPNDPMTWGDAAVMCDPWSNKFYKATDFTKELNTFNMDTVARKNSIGDFDVQKNILVPDERLNSTFLNEHRTVAILQENSYSHIQSLTTTLNRYNEAIAGEIKRLEATYEKHNKKVIILCAKLIEMQEYIQRINQDMNEIKSIPLTSDYREVRRNLNGHLLRIRCEVADVINFTRHDVLSLSSHQGGGLKVALISFFGAKSTTANNFSNIMEKVNKSLSTPPKLK